jgi:hypothetical protein
VRERERERERVREREWGGEREESERAREREKNKRERERERERETREKEREREKREREIRERESTVAILSCISRVPESFSPAEEPHCPKALAHSLAFSPTRTLASKHARPRTPTLPPQRTKAIKRQTASAS